MNGSDLESKPDTFWKAIKYVPTKKSSAICICAKCGEEFSQPKSLAKNIKTCQDCRGKPKWMELKRIVLKSHIQHQEEGSYIECRICGYRAKEIANHVITHAMTVEEYGVTKCQKSIDRVRGENNPAYQHGGRFSPFSDKFVKYQNGSSSYTKTDILSKRKQTVKDNPQNQSTRIEYWLDKGLALEEAEEALSERQTTFSLKKCVERYGEGEGKRIWKKRQEKWLETLDSKSDEEKLEINSKKSSKVNYKTLWSKDLHTPGIFYIVELNGFIKIGVTTRKLKQRYRNQEFREILTYKDSINNCFKIEQLLKTDSNLSPYKIKDSSLFGWTEMFDISEEIVIATFELYKTNFLEEFSLRYPRHAS